MNIIKVINKTFMLVVLSFLLVTVAQAGTNHDTDADANEENAGAWSCVLKKTKLEGGSFGIGLNLTSYVGQAAITCWNPLSGNAPVTRNIELSYEAVGFGLGVSFPKEVYAVSLSNGFKVDHPDNLYGEFQLGVGGNATAVALQFGVRFSIVDPSKGLVFNFQLHTGQAFGLQLVPLEFQKLTIAPLN